MSDRPGVFGWLARVVSAFVGLAQTPRESAELRKEIAARRSGEAAEAGAAQVDRETGDDSG